jgi:tryptophan synthase beta chain
MLYPNVEELRQQYLKNHCRTAFKLSLITKDYVGRPTPLYFAEAYLKNTIQKYTFKREDLCHTGAHKINNTIGKFYLPNVWVNPYYCRNWCWSTWCCDSNCYLMGLQCIVYMGEIDINERQCACNGAEVRPALSGSKTAKDATNEAIRDWINNPVDTYYIIGSVVGPHPYPDMVARFQSVISQEIKTQLLEKKERKPDYVIACVGGGSNAAGTYYHFLDDEDVKSSLSKRQV